MLIYAHDIGAAPFLSVLRCGISLSEHAKLLYVESGSQYWYSDWQQFSKVSDVFRVTFQVNTTIWRAQCLKLGPSAWQVYTLLLSSGPFSQVIWRYETALYGPLVHLTMDRQLIHLSQYCLLFTGSNTLGSSTKVIGLSWNILRTKHAVQQWTQHYAHWLCSSDNNDDYCIPVPKSKRTALLVPEWPCVQNGPAGVVPFVRSNLQSTKVLRLLKLSLDIMHLKCSPLWAG